MTLELHYCVFKATGIEKISWLLVVGGVTSEKESAISRGSHSCLGHQVRSFSNDTVCQSYVTQVTTSSVYPLSHTCPVRSKWRPSENLPYSISIGPLAFLLLWHWLNRSLFEQNNTDTIIFEALVPSIHESIVDDYSRFKKETGKCWTHYMVPRFNFCERSWNRTIF